LLREEEVCRKIERERAFIERDSLEERKKDEQRVARGRGEERRVGVPRRHGVDQSYIKHV